MKKKIALLLTIVLTLSAITAGCGKKDDAADTTAGGQGTETAAVKDESQSGADGAEARILTIGIA